MDKSSESTNSKNYHNGISIFTTFKYEQALSDYNSESSAAADTFRANALFILALIENADEIQVTLTDGGQNIEFTNGRE